MENQQLSQVNSKDLVIGGHKLAKAMGNDYVAELATRLDVALVRGDAHMQAEMVWEKSMMEAIGEDGVGCVVKAINALKAERDALQQKLDEAQEEISRRDAIFIPVYPDENLMNKLTDVFHDTAKIHCDEDGVYIDNAELVITAVINHYLQSPDRNQLHTGNTEGANHA
ncbi:hypothetical protein [Pantoea sp. GM01]|uniref:hypothetical protein n=1 Tax=Pantoea sp. GM01 TaxID=1144320 RepID=UPI000271440C|nr:hypothetical protein [Pantoea sp. GM01]EJL80961.1 hypothetical protein PMI17_05064 [Pantoea sp. GM01]